MVDVLFLALPHPTKALLDDKPGRVRDRSRAPGSCTGEGELEEHGALQEVIEVVV
jgi:hypothetical protein